MERELLTRCGFSRVDLLITIALLALVGSIAISETVSSRTRSEVARVRMDLRRVTLALEAYHVDHKAYPIINAYASNPYLQYNRGELSGAWGLTTPVAYLTTCQIHDPFVHDPYTPGPVSLTFMNTELFYAQAGYGSLGKRLPWYLLSFGPDRIKGPNPRGGNWLYSQYLTATDTDGTYRFLEWQYDPSNGTVSGGDILSYCWRR